MHVRGCLERTSGDPPDVHPGLPQTYIREALGPVRPRFFKRRSESARLRVSALPIPAGAGNKDIL